MDFTLALTHFCEVHGPKSVLCTQVLPLECPLCIPSSWSRSRKSSNTLETNIHQPANDDDDDENSGIDDDDDDTHNDFMARSSHSTRTAGTADTLPTDFSGASTTIESEQNPLSFLQPRLHKTEDQSKNIDPQFRYGRAQGDVCASCAFTVPQKIASQLPKGAPGSLNADDKLKHTAPVLRSRETVCLGPNDGFRKKQAQEGHSSSQESNVSSFRSSGSRHSHTDCHDHTLTYLTTKSPDDPKNYADLRASVIRTLSYEQLPKGMSDGPLWFGDDESGYTIAYVFRLTDPKARGRRRAYAFVALAGKSASRAFKAAPFLWDAFHTMADRIESTAQRYQDEQQKQEEIQSKRMNYTPVASFLTQKATDPDGHVRRAGQTTPRSLADIVGDENIFSIIHQFFVALLQDLGNHFGGIPLAAEQSVYQSISGEADRKTVLTTMRVHGGPKLKLTVSKSRQEPDDDIQQAKERVNKKLQQNSQCGPMVVDATAKGQVVI